MKIGVDLRPLGWGLQAGIPRMIKSIFRELVLFDTEQYIAMGLSPICPFSDPQQGEIPLSSCKSMWSEQLLSSFGSNHKIDVLLSFYYPLPVDRRFPGVLFIHDLIPVRFAAQFGCLEQTVLFERIRYSAQSCQRILTNSCASKQDIVELWGIDNEKIEVVPLAIDDNVKDIIGNYEEKWRHKADELLQRHKIDAPYILSVCTIEPRKNLTRLLQAYEQIRDRRKERFQLIFVGGLGWRYEEFLRRLEGSKWRGDIVMTGYVADWELAVLYHNATVFAYPSLYEGFGLPILEAMGCGVPVVTSMISSMPEVGGDCAYYCDPYSIESIMQALETVLFDEPRQRIMSLAGIKRASQFNWAKTAAIVRRNLLQIL
jgi:glycosyltransferase involved in cell wall biosynthesis